MGKLNIALFQQFQVHVGDVPISGFKSDKARALLAFLAMQPGVPHSRSSLAALLWPDLSEQTALGNLRSALANLRAITEKKFGLTPPLFQADYQTIQLKVDAFACDVVSFERYFAAGQLDEALAVYRGRLLQEFYSGSPTFDDWQRMQADTLSHKAMQGLNTLMRQYLQAGKLQRSIHFAQQQVALEPFNEDAHQNMVYLLALNGQTSAALNQVAICRHALKKEMGVDLSPETLALEKAILRRQKLPAPRLLKPGKPVPIEASPLHMLVSRENELSVLNAHLMAALNGRGRIAFVSGTTGSGKTALIETFTGQAARNAPRLVTLNSSCAQHGELATPFYPFREIFLQITHLPQNTGRLSAATPVATRPLDQLNSSMMKLLSEVAPDLEALLALGSRSFPGHPAVNSADRFTLTLQRGSLYQQSADLLECLADQFPLLITFDDLQWMDADSLDLLYFLGARLKNQRALVVATYRSEDIAGGKGGFVHPLEAYLNEFTRQYGDNRLDLDRSDGRAFVEEYLDTLPNHFSAAFRDTLFHHTGGHALFTVELVDGLKRTENLRQNEQGLWVDNPRIDWDQIPARVEAIINQQLKRLPVFWQHALSVASVEGEYFTGEVLASVLQSQPANLIQGLSRVTGRQHGLVMLEDVRMLNGQRLSIFRFRHSVYQRYLYQRLDGAERSIYHEAVGNALEGFYRDSSGLADVSLQLAHHFEEAGQLQKAAGYYYRNGYAAIQISALLEAEKSLGHAYALLQPGANSAEGNRLAMDILTALSKVDLALHGWGSAERGRDLNAARRVAMERGLAAEQLLINSNMVENLLGGGQWQEAAERSQEVLLQTENLEQSLLSMQARMVEGVSFIFLGRLAEGLALLEEVFAYLDEHRAEIQQGDMKADEETARVVYASGLVFAGRPQQAQAHLDQALRGARQGNNSFAHGLGLTIGGIIKSILLEDDAAALPYAQELVADPKLRQLQAFIPWIEFMEGWLEFNDGQRRNGLRRLKTWGERVKSNAHFLGFPFLLSTLADALRQVGQPAEGERLLSYALQALQQGVGSIVMRGRFLRLRGDCQLARGDAAGAEASYREAIQAAQRQGARLFQLDAANSLCRLKLAQGRAGEELHLLDQIYAGFSEGWDTAPLRTASELLNAAGLRA